MILSNIPRIDGTVLSSIVDQVKAGLGLVVFLGNGVDLRNYNENLNQKLALPSFTETVGEIGTRDVFLTLGKIDFSHPIFAGVFENQKKQIESPQFYFLTKMKLQPHQEKVIEFNNGDPFLIESNFGKGKVLVFASAIDPNWSDLYLKGLFVPLMNRCIMYLAGNANKSSQSFFVNQELMADVTEVSDFTSFQIEKPDGKMTKVIPLVGEGNYKINFKETDIVGIYSLYTGNRLLTQWAVNPDPAESDISPIDSEKLKKIIGNNNIISIQKEEALASIVSTSRYGRELWKYLIEIVLLFLIIEMFLARESANNKPDN